MYLLKSAACMSILLLFYKLLLEKGKHACAKKILSASRTDDFFWNSRH